jgi:ABC-type sugar transport system substrate-binding protein
MKRVLIIVSIFVLITAVAAFGADKKKVVVGLSWNEKMHSLTQAWEDYMKLYSKEYGDEQGVEFQWIVNVADSNPAQQASNIEDLINQEVDVIIARAHDAAAIGASVKAAQDAGIPFVTFDRESSTAPPNAHVGADSYNQAISTAEYFADLVKEKGIEAKVIELMGDLRDMNAVYRSKGWHKVEEDQGAWETIIQVPTEWNPEKFMTGTANALEAHPEANAMFIASDFCFSAVQSALEIAGRWAPTGQEGHMWIAAQDVNPQGYEGMVNGYIDVATTYDAYFHSVEAVKVIARLAAGEDLGGNKFLVAGRVATPENVKDMKNMWARDYKD